MLVEVSFPWCGFDVNADNSECVTPPRPYPPFLKKIIIKQRERAECFICGIHVRSQISNYVFVFAQMKMDGRFEPP